MKTHKLSSPKRPGNFGGETLRQYCGLTTVRRRSYIGKRVARDDGPITAQRLFRAITARAKGGAK